MKKIGILLSLLAMTSVIMAGCGRDEKQSFVDATVESTCLFFETDDIFDPELSEQVKAIFEKHGFGTSDEELEALKDRYAEDTEVQSAILEGISQCGSDFVDDLEVDVSGEDEAMEELDEILEDAEVVEGDAEVVEDEEEVAEDEEEVAEKAAE